MNVWKTLTPDRLVFVATGLLGIVIALLDYVGALDWTVDGLLRMLLVGLGLLMWTVVWQGIRHEEDFGKIEEKLGVPTLRYVNMISEPPNELERGIGSTPSFVHETVLTWQIPHPQVRRDHYREERNKSALRGKLIIRQVVVVHHLQHFEEILIMIEHFKNKGHYELKSYEPAPLAMPALNLVSFDNKDIYVGAPFLTPHPTTEFVLHVHGGKLAEWFSEYWSALWYNSTTNWLLQAGIVNEPALDTIRKRLGLADDEYRTMRDAAIRAAQGVLVSRDAPTV